MNYPAELRYTKEHEWIRMEGSEATIGITDFAQHQLGDIVYVDIATVGKNLAADEVFDLLPTRLYGRFKAESGIFFTLGALDMRYDSQNTRHPLKITFFDTLQVSFR